MSERSRSDDASKEFDARETYGAAAEVYDEASRDYWRFCAVRTVQRLGLITGARVLDVACGTGNAALAAAETVGPAGSVLAIDYAEPMLEIARRKAVDAGLDNLEFRTGDMLRLGDEHGEFDAVTCVLGLFFVDDMAQLLRTLWARVGGGGVLAVTTLGRRVFTPLIDEWRATIRRSTGDVRSVTMPWQRTESPATLARLFDEAGIEGVVLDEEANELPLLAVDDAWKLVMGTGLRSVTTELGRSAQQALRQHLAEWAQREQLRAVQLDVIYAVARKPADTDVAPLV